MKVNMYPSFFLLILCCFNTFAEPCVRWSSLSERVGTATVIASSDSILLNKVQSIYTDIVYADAISAKFWVEECVTEHRVEYSLVSTITPVDPGKSGGVGVYDIAIIQNNQQFDGSFLFSDNLYVSSDFWTAIASFYDPDNGDLSSIPAGFDLRQPFTLLVSCNNIYDNSTNCSAVNSTHVLEINPQPVVGNQSVITSVNGAWYDPNYDGSGFNIAQTTAGFLMYFYGYKEGSNGETLWLASAIGPETIHMNESFTLDMYSGYPGNGGSLTTKPDTANSGTSIWGTAEVTFFSCSNGKIQLRKSNGTIVTHNISLLVGIDGVNCQ